MLCQKCQCQITYDLVLGYIDSSRRTKCASGSLHVPSNTTNFIL